MFEEIYELFKNEFSMPSLTKEPEIITYDDQFYALNWWPHLIYRQEFDELQDHSQYALSKDGEYYHKNYVDEVA